MKKETKKNEGPTCACGRVDIYKEMLKTENNKKEASDATSSNQSKDSSDSSESDLNKD